MKIVKMAAVTAALVVTTSANAALVPFSDDLSSGGLGNWTLEGRLSGGYTTDVVNRYGSEMGHIIKNGFTEAALTNNFEYSTNLTFEFDMEASSNSNYGTTSNLYGLGGVQFVFYDSTNSLLGGVAYGSFSSSYIATVHGGQNNWNSNYIASNVLNHYSLSIDNLLSQVVISPESINHIDMSFISYASANGAGGEVWFDNVSVSAVPVPAGVWLFGSGLIGLAGFARRKKA